MDCHRPGGAEKPQQFRRQDLYKSEPGHSGRDTETQSSRTQGQAQGMFLGGEYYEMSVSEWTKRLLGVKGTDSGDTEPLPGCWGRSTFWVVVTLLCACEPTGCIQFNGCKICALHYMQVRPQSSCLHEQSGEKDGPDSGVHMDCAQDHQPPTTQSQQVFTSSGVYTVAKSQQH